MTIGITGSIASGKTEVAHWFGHWGARVIEADHIGHELLDPRNPFYRRIVRAFGSSILFQNGRINRRCLGQLVFNDHAKLEILNKVVHPPLINALEKSLSITKYKSHREVVAVAALIPEWRIENHFDLILTIAATRQQRLSRLCRRGFSCREARQRLSSQLPERAKKNRADLIIVNKGTLNSLRRKAKDIWNLITEDS